ncbi:hypothetical protein H112_08227 [Trichophyton rubrum D6]|uniref:Uncharacterized protein n=3 Tax=Trichophyton TaxID=5550 RepID=A0A080WGR5_TRIRC|nr:uncharacterized protein TERG_11632 [Trichophyton rubrum CBS 118892]EZF10527.1 hypothetical protein H100_08251 [Trichophyton rubrum MR850]EZF37397.1 hypothetical protein H102_08208 [Trichophyton rubrum CBS 100081]EZF48036.1 hypothetical protein H103_08233 [Trichophyton rubrum CBS 288.86]EZF58692.1 hypothetical protein H104_08184 [Trichophyton rubrum CBS 289.86]EZF69295.1 hypothetical protein H105_08236 [Trichophyton soudanense CBS 452.61]EZF79967.1 hypothetical protein H110_08231 [Trichophy
MLDLRSRTTEYAKDNELLPCICDNDMREVSQEEALKPPSTVDSGTVTFCIFGAVMKHMHKRLPITVLAGAAALVWHLLWKLCLDRCVHSPRSICASMFKLPVLLDIGSGIHKKVGKIGHRAPRLLTR